MNATTVTVKKKDTQSYVEVPVLTDSLLICLDGSHNWNWLL